MNLNDLKSDSNRVAESIRFLSEQITAAAAAGEKLALPAGYRKISRVVVNGMGGSNLGARIIASVFKEEAKVPILVEPGYLVPGFVGPDTLYLIISYSGNTEEPLSAYAEAKKRGAKIAAITAAGPKNKLAELIRKESLPAIVFPSDKNPSGQPRLGLGYLLMATLIVLDKAGAIEFHREELGKIIAALEKNNARLDLPAAAAQNPARKIAARIFNKEIVLVGGEFLEGNLHAWRNQFCESSKNFAQYLVLPEMNHYSLEGLARPKANPKNLVWLFIASGLYSPRVRKRFRLTGEIVKKSNFQALEYRLTGKTKLLQAAELLQFGAWVTYYLAGLNGVDPAPIPRVDWFKKKLG